MAKLMSGCHLLEHDLSLTLQQKHTWLWLKAHRSQEDLITFQTQEGSIIPQKAVFQSIPGVFTSPFI